MQVECKHQTSKAIFDLIMIGEVLRDPMFLFHNDEVQNDLHRLAGDFDCYQQRAGCNEQDASRVTRLGGIASVYKFIHYALPEIVDP